jgi:excisionase family DNA binding protein
MRASNTESATITVEQSARILGIGRNTAYELAKQGKLPGALRLGRRIVVSRKALEKLLAEAGKPEPIAPV